VRRWISALIGWGLAGSSTGPRRRLPDHFDRSVAPCDHSIPGVAVEADARRGRALQVEAAAWVLTVWRLPFHDAVDREALDPMPGWTGWCMRPAKPVAVVDVVKCGRRRCGTRATDGNGWAQSPAPGPVWARSGRCGGVCPPKGECDTTQRGYGFFEQERHISVAGDSLQWKVTAALAARSRPPATGRAGAATRSTAALPVSRWRSDYGSRYGWSQSANDAEYRDVPRPLPPARPGRAALEYAPPTSGSVLMSLLGRLSDSNTDARRAGCRSAGAR
jgi:hypothetical protein